MVLGRDPHEKTGHTRLMKIALGSTLSVALIIGLVVSGPAGAQQSITGKWAIDKKCTAPLSSIIIEPLGLAGEDFYCKFDHVSRRRDRVSWRGQCNFSEEGYEPTTVTATLRGRRLFYRFAGRGWNGPFERCAR